MWAIVRIWLDLSPPPLCVRTLRMTPLKDMIIGSAFTAFFQSGRNNVEIGHLMLPGAFPGKGTPDIDFIDEVVV